MAEEKKFDIEILPEIASGIYSNLAVINHSSNEFIMDFIQMMPGIPKPTVKTRVIMTPENTKRLLRALMENVQKYESQFGEIKFRENPAARPMGFGGET